MKGFFGTNSSDLFIKLNKVYTEQSWSPQSEKNYMDFTVGFISHKNKSQFINKDFKDVKIFFTGSVFDVNENELIDDIYLMYKRNDLKSVSLINGYFQIVIFDKRRKFLTLVSDRYGLTKFYIYKKNETFAFSFRFLPLLDSIDKKTVNKESIYEFLSFRYILGNKTFINEIFQSGPASIIKYDLVERKISHEKYWDFSFNTDNENTSLNMDGLLKTTYELWQQSVEKRIRNKFPVIIPLSGGKDSRAILAASLEITEAKNIKTFSYGQKSSYDFQIAKKVAEKAGVESISLAPDTKNIEGQFHDNFENNDGLFTALPSFPLENMKRIREVGDTLISGYIGDFIFGSNTPESVLREYSNTENPEGILLDSVRFHRKEIISSLLGKQVEAKKGINISESERKEHLYNIFPKFFLENHIYNFTYHSCPNLKNTFNYEFPFLDNKLVDFVSTLPFRFRYDQEMYKKFLKKYYNKLFSLPIKNNFNLKISSSQLKQRLKYNYYVKTTTRLNRFNSIVFGIDFPVNKTLNYLNYEHKLRHKSDYKEFIWQHINGMNNGIIEKQTSIDLFQKHQNSWVDYSYLLSQIVTLDMVIGRIQ